MRKLNNRINLDRANSAADNISTGENPMRNASKKTPWHLRFAPGALRLKEMAATAGVAVIYGLLFAGLLFAPLLPHLEAQTSSTNPVAVRDTRPTHQAGGSGVRLFVRTSDGTTYGITSSTATLQDGAQPQWVWTILPVLGGTGLRIAWRKWLFGASATAAGTIGGRAVWNAATKTWELPPGATRKGKIRAMGDIWLSKVDGQRTYWYGQSGEWVSQEGWKYNSNGLPIHNTHVESKNMNRDYHYIDYTYEELVWDGDNEIWKSGTNAPTRVYNTEGYDPDFVNRVRNNGEHGAWYPDHEDYKKGKKGYVIVWGTNTKNYLSHEFKSTVSGEDKHADLASEAKKEKKDTFNPVAIVTVSDMTYESDGWKYTRRAPSDAHVVTRELSTVEDDTKTLNDKEYIPLNARHEETKYHFDICVTYWKAETDWKTGNVQPKGSNIILTNQRMPYRKYVPEQYITSTDPVDTD